jgi:hypothetical protein
MFSSDRSLRPIQPAIERVTAVLSPGWKQPGREADHAPSSSAEIKNGGVIPPFPDGMVLDRRATVLPILMLASVSWSLIAG